MLSQKALSERCHTAFSLDVSLYDTGKSSRSLEIRLFPRILEGNSSPGFMANYLNANSLIMKTAHALVSHLPVDPFLKLGGVFFERGGTMEENINRFVKAPRLEQVPHLLIGNWQNEDYFRDSCYIIRDAFQFPDTLSPRTARLMDSLKSMSNSVSIHVRRGDYLSPQFCKYYVGVCTDEYYIKAIETICAKIESPRFVVFSDDIAWSMENFPLQSNAIVVDWNQGEDSWQDMLLMSCCKHHIIANSSFSWWGAWLGDLQGKTITVCPKRWYADDKWEKDAGQFVPCHSWVKV